MVSDTLSFSEVVRREIRAEMGRQNLNSTQLARRLGWSRARLTARLHGEVPLSLDDVEQIAAGLSISTLQLAWPRQTV
jgi:transcriptional regulator with XRE-family HTH domain